MSKENRLTKLLFDERCLPFPTEGGHIGLFREISEYALDDGIGKNGDTKLIDAIRSRDLDQVSTLIQCGVNPNIKNKDGWTALMVASCGYGCTHQGCHAVSIGGFSQGTTNQTQNAIGIRIGDTYEFTKIIEALLKAEDLDLNLKNNEGKSALDLAIRYGYRSNVEFLEAQQSKGFL